VHSRPETAQRARIQLGASPYFSFDRIVKERSAVRRGSFIAELRLGESENQRSFLAAPRS